MTTLGTTPVAGITCPSWCSVTQSTHLRELRWEGRALHWSDARTGEGWEIRHTAASDADGRTLDIEPKVYVTTNGGLTLAGAEALALTLLATYEEATD
jgi:hypothetical protein